MLVYASALVRIQVFRLDWFSELQYENPILSECTIHFRHTGPNYSCIPSLKFTFYYNCAHTHSNRICQLEVQMLTPFWKIWVLTHCETRQNTGSQCTAGQVVSVLRWSIVYPYLPVTILHNFTSIQSKMKWYPKGIVTEPLWIWTIQAILLRMSSPKETQHFIQLLKYQCLHAGITFLCWTTIMLWILQGAWDSITSQIPLVFAETMCA